MYCRNCGKEYPDNTPAVFCENCGIQLHMQPDSNAPTQATNNPDNNKATSSSNGSTDFLKKTAESFGKLALWKKITAIILVAAIIFGSVFGIVSCTVCTCAPEEKAPAKLESSSFCLFDFNYVDYQVNDKDTAKQAVVDASSLLGLEDIQATLQFTNETKTFDTTVYRFNQSWNGIPVYGRSAALLCDASGTVLSYTGNLADIDETIEIPASVAITEETTKTIIDSINAYYGSDYKLFSDISYESDDAVIYIKDGKSLLAYRIDVCFGTDEESYYERFIIDLENGEVLCCEVLINDNGISQSKTVETSAAVNNVTVQRPNVNIEISRFNDGVVSLVNKKNGQDINYAKSVIVKPGSSEWTANGRTLYNTIDICLDFYWEKFARNSYDNKGGTINAYYNDMYDSGNNAYAVSNFIDSTSSFPAEIHHLLGEGIISVGKNTDSGNIETLGHEFTHIVTYCTWHPSAQKGETSAVNEALSDIFGQLIEHYASGTSDWIQGDRNIADPGSVSVKYEDKWNAKKYKYPDTYMGDGWLDTSSSLDDGGEHHNSTVLSHAAYEMTRINRKGTLTYDQLGELWYRTMLTLPSDSKFSDVRACIESTAQIMYREGKLDEQNIKMISKVFDEANITSARSSNYNIAPGAKLTVLHNDNTVDNTYNILIVENAANRFSFKINESVETGFEFPSDMKSGTYQVYISPSDGSVKEVISFSVEIKKRGTDELKIYTDFEPPLIIAISATDASDETVETVDDSEKLYDHLMNSLIPEYGLSDFSPFTVYSSTGGYTYTVPQSTRGIIGYAFTDSDNDGHEEMSVFILNENGEIEINAYGYESSIKHIGSAESDHLAKLPPAGNLEIIINSDCIIISVSSTIPPGFSRYGTTTCIYRVTPNEISCLHEYHFWRSPGWITCRDYVTETVFYDAEEDLESYDYTYESEKRIISDELSALGITYSSIELGWGDDGNEAAFGMFVEYDNESLIIQSDFFGSEYNDDFSCSLTDYSGIQDYSKTYYASQTTSTSSTTAATTTQPQTGFSSSNCTISNPDETHDPYDIHADAHFLIANTPAGAGVVMRDLPDPSGTNLGTINEGSVVTAINGYSSMDNGYVWVSFKDRGINGWVLAQYMYPTNPYSDYGYSGESLTETMHGRVCFSTPADAGINMRAQPAAQSDLLTTLHEGTVVDILQSYDPSNNGYIKIGYDHPQAGEYYNGWVLASYIEFYGYEQ